MFFVDMHCHSVSSDDSRATVEQYLKWITHLRRQGHRVDAIVLTEHRKFDADKDYTSLAAQYGVTVLKGSELDTRHGHFLVYGVDRRLMDEVDLADVAMDSHELVRVARDVGAIAFPAHPGRAGIGLAEFLARGVPAPEVGIVETLNGGGRRGENERAEELAQARGYRGVGGSDAHFVSAIASCLTAFPHPVRDERELVEALRSGDFRPVRLADTAALAPGEGAP